MRLTFYYFIPGFRELDQGEKLNIFCGCVLVYFLTARDFATAGAQGYYSRRAIYWRGYWNRRSKT